MPNAPIAPATMAKPLNDHGLTEIVLALPTDGEGITITELTSTIGHWSRHTVRLALRYLSLEGKVISDTENASLRQPHRYRRVIRQGT
jgi:response regulator of citrate/malate metabolism